MILCLREKDCHYKSYENVCALGKKLIESPATVTCRFMGFTIKEIECDQYTKTQNPVDSEDQQS